MARTRATAKLVEQLHGLTATADVNDGTANTRVASFNGTLHQYQYDDVNNKIQAGSASAIRATANGRKRKVNGPDEEPASNSTTIKAKVKKQRQASKYAPPSKYAHLSHLTDIIEPNLIAVFVGFNPGVQTATQGHAYAHPSNLFWKLLHSSGVTERRLTPAEDVTLPQRYQLGNTNLVSRPSANTAELSKEEQLASVPILEAKVRKFRPEAVCIVGKSIWETIWHYRKGKKIGKGEFRYGWQDEVMNMGLIDEAKERAENEIGGWNGARVFVATSTSGLSASLSYQEKEDIWRPFAVWVNNRREERKLENGDAPNTSS